MTAETSPQRASGSQANSADGGANLKWTRPRQARSAGQRATAAGAVGQRSATAAAATQAAQRIRTAQAAKTTKVARASHEETVEEEPDRFPETLVPPANAKPLLPTDSPQETDDADLPMRRADLALESEVAVDEPELVVEETAVFEESNSTLREMMDAVAASADTTELQMASRLQPVGDSSLERPQVSNGQEEPATDAMLQDVFGSDEPSVAEPAGDLPAMPDLPADGLELPSEGVEAAPLDSTGATDTTPEASESASESSGSEEAARTPSEGPPRGEEEALMDPGDFIPEGSQAGDAEPPADRQPGDEVVDFNGRDCARERHMLQSAWHEMRQTPLHSISLDITPSLEPTGTDEEAEKARVENMGRAPARVWHDKEGQVVARGKMVDFKNSRVIVQDESGTLKHLSWYQLGNDELCFVSSWWELPTDATAENAKFAGRNWTPMTMTWVASALCHKPLYFEDVQLERYGHSAKPVRQAALSGVHFFGSIFLLPYHMGLNPPTECQYALGYYRPGSCAPWLVPAFPWSGRAARMQAGALSGAILWYP